MFLNEKSIVNLALVALFFKLLISPWSTGDFQSAVFLSLNYLCDGVILIAIVMYTPYQLKRFSFVYFTAIILLFSLYFSTIILTDKPAFNIISAHLKIYQPLLFFTMLATYFSRNLDVAVTISKNIVIYTSILLFIGILLLPVSYNRTDVWWPSYFGGLHTTAYVAMSAFFIAFTLYLHKHIKLIPLIIIGLVVFYSIFFGWGVRTITGAFFIAVGSHVIQKFKINDIKAANIVIPVSLLIGAFLLVVMGDANDFDHFTSGRLSMYAEKIDQLSRNSLFSWVFGNGVGSDLITTDIWWWAAKGAHSDFITMLVEGGLIYLIGTLFVFYRIYKMFPDSQAKFFILAILFTSAFSNGYLVRPITCYVFYFSLALFFAYLPRGNSGVK